MKTIFTPSFTALFSLCLFVSAQAQNDPILTLVTTLNPQGAKQLIFQPSGDLEIDYWNTDLVEIQIYIEDDSFSRQQLKSLIPIGFYKITSTLEGSTLKVYMPNQSKAITINGKQVNSSIKYRIKLPHNILLKYRNIENDTLVKAF